jgi:hypothetical protein
MKLNFTLAAIILLIMNSVIAQAASYDFNYSTTSTLFTANDGTKMEWLHLDEYNSTSYVDMLSLFSTSGPLQGYQYATRSEVGLVTQQLLGFDWSVVIEQYSSSYIGRTNSIASIFGYSELGVYSGQVYGVTADVHPTYSINPGDRRYELMAWDSDRFANTNNEFMSAERIYGISSVSAEAGHFAYRTVTSQLSAVPIPAAAILFAPALLGFVGLRRKANKFIS